MPAGVTLTSLSAGYQDSLAIGDNQKVYAWGNGLATPSGEGVDGTEDILRVVKLPTGVSPQQVSAGRSHFLVLGGDGNVYAWGKNKDGQLGVGCGPGQLEPVATTMPVGASFTSVSAGGCHSLALTNKGVAYARGGGWLPRSTGQRFHESLFRSN